MSLTKVQSAMIGSVDATTLTGVVPIANGGTGNTAGVTGFKNRLINGTMTFDQRNNGASVTPTSDGQYTLDRWTARLSQSSKYSVQQVADAPTGFLTSLKVTSLSAYSVSSSDYFQVGQYLEGLNAYDLMWGTSSAKTMTLSFWVKSSLTGTFGGCLFAYQTGVPSYPFSYTISVANTWEYKTVTIVGPTSGSASFNTNNSGYCTVLFSIGVGSSLSGTANTWNYSTLYRAPTGATSVVGTNGATFQITGCQFEVGTAATNYDVRSIGTELGLCQRYFEMSYNQGSAIGSFTVGWKGTSTNGTVFAEGPGWAFMVPKRANPTVVLYNAVAGTANRAYQVSSAASITVATRNVGQTGIGIIDYTSSGGQNSYYIHYTADAEL